MSAARSRYTGGGKSGKEDEGQQCTRIPIFKPGKWIRLRNGEVVQVESLVFSFTEPGQKQGVWRVFFSGGRSAIVLEVERFATEEEIRGVTHPARPQGRQETRPATVPTSDAPTPLPSRSRASERVSRAEAEKMPDGWQEALRTAERIAERFTRLMPDNADDALSVAYEAVCNAARVFPVEPGRSFPLFAARAVRWRLVEWCRRRKAAKRDWAFLPVEDLISSPAADAGIYAALLVEEIAESLHPLDRSILLAKLQEEEESEIGRRLGIPEGSVSARWFRLRRRLRERYPEI